VPFPASSRSASEFFNVVRLPEIIAEDGDVDVFGKALDQPEALGKRRAALEEQARPVREAVE